MDRRDGIGAFLALLFFGIILGAMATRAAEAYGGSMLFAVPAPYQVIENPRMVFVTAPGWADVSALKDMGRLIADRFRDSGIRAAVFICLDDEPAEGLCGTPLLAYPPEVR